MRHAFGRRHGAFAGRLRSGFGRSGLVRQDAGCGPRRRSGIAAQTAVGVSALGRRPLRGLGRSGQSTALRAPWARGPRTPKARRGDVRAAILAVLADQSLNGYQIIQEIAERSRGVWKPSPGSIYPTLQQLEDEGLVQAEEDGRPAGLLPDRGGSHATSPSTPTRSPRPGRRWRSPTTPRTSLKPLIGQVAAAVWQIVAVGTPRAAGKGREALVELRTQAVRDLGRG